MYIYGVIDSLLSWVFGGCGTLIDRKNWNDVGSRKEWGAETYSYMESALPGHWMYLQGVCQHSGRTTQLWWRAVKSPGVCANKLPCFAFALTKSFNGVTTSVSVLCLPFPPVPSTGDYFCGRQQWTGVNEPGLTQISLLQIPTKVHPDNSGFLEINALLLDMPPEQVM